MMPRWKWKKVAVTVKIDMQIIAEEAAKMGITPRAYLSRLRDMRFTHPDQLEAHIAYEDEKEAVE